MRIEVVVFDGFDELDAFGPYEVLRHAAAAGAEFDVELVGAHGGGTIVAANGVQVVVERGLGQPDAVVVPGGGWLDRADAGAWAEVTDGRLLAQLRELADAPTTRWLASVCTGAMLLAHAGVLDGHAATTNRQALTELAAFDVSVRQERVVDDGAVITAGGPSAGLDLGLWITEREAGRPIADRTADEIEYERQGQVTRRPA